MLYLFFLPFFLSTTFFTRKYLCLPALPLFLPFFCFSYFFYQEILVPSCSTTWRPTQRSRNTSTRSNLCSRYISGENQSKSKTMNIGAEVSDGRRGTSYFKMLVKAPLPPCMPGKSRFQNITFFLQQFLISLFLTNLSHFRKISFFLSNLSHFSFKSFPFPKYF